MLAYYLDFICSECKYKGEAVVGDMLFVNGVSTESKFVCPKCNAKIQEQDVKLSDELFLSTIGPFDFVIREDK